MNEAQKYFYGNKNIETQNQIEQKLYSREVAEMVEMLNTSEFNVKKESINNAKVVYIISDNEGNLKIGVTKDYEKRIKVLENTSGRKIVNKFKTPYCSNAYEIETKLLNVYSSKRLKGEWFKCDFNEVVNRTVSIFLEISKRDTNLKPKINLFDAIEKSFSKKER